MKFLLYICFIFDVSLGLNISVQNKTFNVSQKAINGKIYSKILSQPSGDHIMVSVLF